MEKIKRYRRGSRSGLHIFFKAIIYTILCIALIAIGFFAAAYYTGYMG